MKVGITGASGFIGKNLVDYLLEKGYEIVIYKRENSKTSYFNNKNVKFREIDYFDKNNLNGKFSDIDCLIYLSGLTKSLNTNMYYKVNYEALKNVVDEINLNNPDLHFIYASTQAATGPAKDWNNPKKIDEKESPISNYGKSKLKGEKYLISNIKNFTVFRLVSVFGPYDFDGLKFFKMALSKFVFNAGKQLPKLNLIYVKELVKNLEFVIAKDKFFKKRFHMGYPEIITTEKFVETIRKTCGINKKYYYIKIPIPVVEVFSIFLDFFQKLTGKISILNKEKIMEIKALYWIVDSDEFYKFSGLKVKYPFEQMVKDTLNFYIKNGYIKKVCSNLEK